MGFGIIVGITILYYLAEIRVKNKETRVIYHKDYKSLFFKKKKRR